MYALVLIVHVIVALFLVGVILLQGGRGGLGEAMGGAAAQSLFGGGANTVMSRITAVAAGMFMVTCLSLAALSTRRGRSIIEQMPATVDQLPATLPVGPEPAAPASAQPPAPSAPAPAASAAPATPAPTTAK